MTTKTTPFKNFVALTAIVSDVEHKTSGKTGKPYAVAAAEVSQLEGQPSLTLRVIAVNGLGEKLTEGEHTLVGRIGYEEDEKGAGRLLFFPSKIEEPPADGRKRNFANLTLRVGAEPYASYSEAGRFWARLRAFLSMGKTEDGSAYKPSLWLTVKGFERDGDESLPAQLAALQKGESVTFTGRLAWEVYNEKGSLNLIAFKAEPLVVTAPVEEDECPV